MVMNFFLLAADMADAEQTCYLKCDQCSLDCQLVLQQRLPLIPLRNRQTVDWLHGLDLYHHVLAVPKLVWHLLVFVDLELVAVAVVFVEHSM